MDLLRPYHASVYYIGHIRSRLKEMTQSLGGLEQLISLSQKTHTLWGHILTGVQLLGRRNTENSWTITLATDYKDYRMSMSMMLKQYDLKHIVCSIASSSYTLADLL